MIKYFNNMKKEKGSITLFVLIACMFMLIIILLINIAMINKNSNQEKELDEISKAYGANETDIENVYANTVDENEYATIGDVYKIVNEEIDNLFPTEYTAPTVVDGVSISNGGYVRIGNLVVVNMSISINTSELTISKNPNKPTVIASGFPEPDMISALASYYTFISSSGSYSMEYNWTGIDQNENLSLCQDGTDTYTSGYGIRIIGAYIINE